VSPYRQTHRDTDTCNWKDLQCVKQSRESAPEKPAASSVAKLGSSLVTVAGWMVVSLEQVETPAARASADHPSMIGTEQSPAEYSSLVPTSSVWHYPFHLHTTHITNILTNSQILKNIKTTYYNYLIILYFYLPHS